MDLVGPLSALVVAVVAWGVSVEKRLTGHAQLRRDVRRIDRRTMKILIATDPAAAAREISGEQHDEDERETEV